MSTVQATKWGIGIAVAFILQLGGNIWWAAQKDVKITDLDAKVEQLSAEAKVVEKVHMERDIKTNAENVARIATQMESVAATLAGLVQKIDTVANQEVEIDMGGYVDQQQFDNYMNHVAERLAQVASDGDMREVRNELNTVINRLGNSVDARDLAELRALVNRYERSLAGGINELKRDIEDLNGILFDIEDRLAEVEDKLGL